MHAHIQIVGNPAAIADALSRMLKGARRRELWLAVDPTAQRVRRTTLCRRCAEAMAGKRSNEGLFLRCRHDTWRKER